MPRSKPKAQRLAPPLPNDTTALGTATALESVRRDIPSDSKPSKRRRVGDVTAGPASRHEQRSSVGPLGPISASRNTSLERHADGTGTMLDDARPRSSRLSCSSSDTASIGLAEDIPHPVALGGTSRFPLDDNLSKKHNNPAIKRTSNGRAPSNSFRKSGPFQRVLDSSRARKRVEADPTPPSIPPALGEVPFASRTETVARSDRKYSFLSDDEAKSVFEHDACNLSSEKVRLSQRVDKGKMRDYWKDLGAVSIRKSSQTEKRTGNGRHSHVKLTSDHVSMLHPNNRNSSIEVIKTANATPFVQLDSELLNISKRGQVGQTLHPVTEENLDGGDAIPLTKHRKRKSLKKGKSGTSLIGRSAENRSQARPFEQKKVKDTKRKKTSTSRWVQRINNSNASGEAIRPGQESADPMRTTVRRGNEFEEMDDTASSTGFSESDGQACMQCGGHGKASKMVLCDACSDGCHTFCMRPARTSVPLGVWICPRCHVLAKKHEIHLSKLSLFLEEHSIQCEKA